MASPRTAPRPTLRAVGLAAGLALLFAPAAAAVERGQRGNAPSSCPYCGGEPERMEPAGVVSHGGFEFATTDTAGIDALLVTSDIRWIETEHFELGFALGPYKVTQREKNKIRAELTELSEVLPDVDPRAKILDPWLRAHLFGARMEKTWDRMLEILQVEESEFPDGESEWLIGTPYMGEGPYLGQKGKYEVLIVETEADQVMFLRDQFGLQITRTQRWNVVDRDTLDVTMHVRQGHLRNDTALHGHVVFNLSHVLLDGYKHYSYDTPLWIHEGLAHFLEREITTRYSTFDAAEGSLAAESRKQDWDREVASLVASDEAPRLAELMGLQSYSAFELRHHFATWSMVKYLIEEHPAGFACLNDRIHGRTNDEGYADGSNMPDVHRKAFEECLAMGYFAFDAAWREWARSR